MSEESEKYVLDYLDRVADEAQRRIRQPSERIKLVEDLRDRIDKAAARKGHQLKAVRKILADLGPAEHQVDEYLARRAPGAPVRPEAARVQAPPRTEVRPRPEPGPRADVRPRPETAPATEATTPPAAAGQPETMPRAEAGPATTPRPEPPPADIAGMEAARVPAEVETRPINVIPGVPGPPVTTGVRPRVTLGDLPPAVLIAAVLLVVSAATLLFGWFGWVVMALVALRWPPAARGVRVVSLIFIPLFSLPFFLLIGIASDVNEVMRRIYPFGIGVLGAAYLLWGAFRYPRSRPTPPPPTDRPPRRPQRRAYRGLSRQDRG